MAEIVLYVRHLPCKILNAEFSDIMDALGLDSRCFHLRIPTRRSRSKTNNFGYGFVTCSRRSDAEAFVRTFHGFQFENIQTCKRLSVEQAHRSALSTDFSAWHMEMPMTFDADMLTHEYQGA
eukprot:TRINITY_DN32601_c0_g1_i2.p1 TRINITY_DN32601_c0_g1~~TRINITY_DN32601_c0_g1_i2.p1  ORF type:complete len:143 (+),score=13.28 TRINITY_DN32601_c0_g1_i2:64-429(+)